MIKSLLASAARYAAQFGGADLAARPSKRVAIVACMDARLNLYGLLGLREGDAHVLRNAGGVVTDDVIRSLAISQEMLGTETIILVHHTDCGMTVLPEEELSARLARRAGSRPPFRLETFEDVDADVRNSIERIHASPFVFFKQAIYGFVFDVRTGQLRAVGSTART